MLTKIETSDWAIGSMKSTLTILVLLTGDGLETHSGVGGRVFVDLLSMT